MDWTLRDATSADLADVQLLNEAVTPAVNSLDLKELRWFLQHAS
ncbi:MAG: hypothetical protein AAF917_12155 [Pseudomonadota bacterium]